MPGKGKGTGKKPESKLKKGLKTAGRVGLAVLTAGGSESIIRYIKKKKKIEKERYGRGGNIKQYD